MSDFDNDKQLIKSFLYNIWETIDMPDFDIIR